MSTRRLSAVDRIRRAASGPRSIVVRVAVTVLFLALAVAFPHPQASGAVSERYRVYPGLDDASLSQYGLHFDETGTGNYAFGARDFNSPGDGSSPSIYFRVQLTQAYGSGVMFYFTRYGSPECNLKVQAGVMDEWGFYPYTGEVFNHLHLYTLPATGNYAGPIYSVNEGVYEYVGKVAPVGNDCVYDDAPHLHQSGNLNGTSVGRVLPASNESCWTNNDGTYSWQCPGTYPDHSTCSTASGTAGVSGTITEYICQTWGYTAWSPSFRLFTIVW